MQLRSISKLKILVTIPQFRTFLWASFLTNILSSFILFRFIFLHSTITEDKKNWTYTLRPTQLDVPMLYTEDA